MFETLRKLIGDLSEAASQNRPGARQFDEDDHRLAAAALLVHVADADGDIEPREQERLRALAGERFGLDAAEAAQLIREALWSDHEAVSIDHFVNILRRALDGEGRLKLVEMMWDVVYADGEASETEDTMIWRIAGKLGVGAQEQDVLRRSRTPGFLRPTEGSGGTQG